MDESLYAEELRSNWTSALFGGLAAVFLALFAWRVSVSGWAFLPSFFLFLGAFFILYLFNYRTLRIRLTSRTLALHFGLVRWKTDLENIQSCRRDDSPWFIRYGGAGVHFAMVRGMYRAFFNFLEGPRLLVIFKHRQGWVSGLVFTTRQPESLLALLQRKIADE